MLKRPVNFWTNFANFDHCGTASNYVPCMWPLQTSVSSKILRSSDTLSKSLKEGGGFAKIKSKSDNPLLAYLAPILLKPHVIYYTKQPFYKPVLHLHICDIPYLVTWHICDIYLWSLFLLQYWWDTLYKNFWISSFWSRVLNGDHQWLLLIHDKSLQRCTGLWHPLFLILFIGGLFSNGKWL